MSLSQRDEAPQKVMGLIPNRSVPSLFATRARTGGEGR